MEGTNGKRGRFGDDSRGSGLKKNPNAKPPQVEDEDEKGEDGNSNLIFEDPFEDEFEEEEVEVDEDDDDDEVRSEVDFPLY